MVLTLASKYVNFDTISAIIFLIIIATLIIRYRKALDFQVLLKLVKVPLLYIVLWRTKFGLGFMDRIANKYREFIKLLGYCFVGIGFVGMLFISINVLIMLFRLFIAPKETSQEVALVLPFTHIPGIGYLSFWHFLITIFITVLLHEFAHGIVARAHKVPVNSSGLGIFSILMPIAPLAFVEPDEKKLPKEQDIVQYSIFSAGPVVNIFFAFLVILFFSYALTPLENKITAPIGVSYAGIMENYSAKDVGMQPGMIINKINDVEVLDYNALQRELIGLKPESNITLGTTNGTFNIVLKPGKDDQKKGYIGITGPYTNERKINEKYSTFGPLFFWFKGLMRWMFFINLIVGLMNLLPIIITDGGRILKVAAERIMSDTKKADKIVAIIGLIFLGTLLLALLIKYTSGLFSLIG